MNCSDCQTKFCDLSAEVLDSHSALELRKHLEQCEPCRCEWVLFERCLSLVSTVPQPLPTPLATEQMWHRCFEHIFAKVESARAGRDAGAEYSSTAASSAPRGWFLRQPRWSWAVLGLSLMVLASAWLAVPRDAVESGAQFVESPATPGQLITMQRPPASAAGLVNHHSAMNVDPFTNYVGSTMVSYSATSSRR